MSRVSFIAVLCVVASGTLAGQVSGVRVFMDPPGPWFNLDGQTFTNPVTQLWPAGSKHSLSTNSPQTGAQLKTRYVCNSWETNRGPLTPSPCPPVSITADPDITYVKGVFSVFYAVTLSYFFCPEGMTCRSPATIVINGIPYRQDTEVYLPAGSSVKIEAYPNDGWVFGGWGQLPGGNSNSNAFVTTFTLNQPQVVRPILTNARNLQVNVNTSPGGLTLLIDRTPMTAPFLLDWGWNTDHTVGTLPSQRDANGRLLIFDSWSDGGEINHVFRMPPAGSAPVNLTARFVPGAAVSFLTDPAGLKLTVDGRENWPNYTFAWAAGTSHTVSAGAEQTDAQGRKYKFISWSNGGPASQQISVAAAPDDVRYTATYAPVAQINLTSNPPGLKLQVDGGDCVTPCAIERAVGAPVRILAPAMLSTSDSSRLVFQGWLDGGSLDRRLTATALPQNITVNYQTQFRLDLSTDPPDGVNWRIQPESPDAYYDAQTAVSVFADTKPGFRFLGWSGDISAASARQASLTMSAPKTIVALLDRIPFVPPGAVRNAAGAAPDDVVAPGSVVSITGMNLAPREESSPGNILKQILAGVTVWIGDELAPLFFVSPEQINAQLPSDLPEGNQTLILRSEGKPDTKVSFTVARNAPGLFTQSSGGVTFVLAAHADGSLVTPDSAAASGETITIFGTGLGPYVGTAADGFAVGEAPDLILADPVSVVLPDSVLTPVYAGIAAGRVGVNAVRFVVPEPRNDETNVPVKVVSGGRESNTSMLPLRR